MLKFISSLLVLVLVVVVQVRTAEPEPITTPILGTMLVQADSEKPKPPLEGKPLEKKSVESPQTDVFAQNSLPGTNFGSAFNPHMMGDFPGFFARRTIPVVGSISTTTTVTTTTPQPPLIIVIPPAPGDPTGQPPRPTIVVVPRPPLKNTVTTNTVTPTVTNRTIFVPVTAAGAFKIAENASPRPQDRVFVTGNYFGDIRGAQTGANVPINSTAFSSSSIPGVVDTARTSNVFIPGAPLVTGDLYRETIGFEKTFLDGDASVELRVPFAQLTSNVGGIALQNIGDISIISKFAFLNDRTTGDVISGGFVVTAPTGPSTETIAGNLHSTLVQPWAGYIWNADRFFVQAFHSVVIPTDSRVTTLLFNDIGLNYWLYRGDPDRFLSFVVPMAEAHVTTPLDHRDASAPLLVPDLVVLTGGVHLGLFRNTTLSLGVATPVTGPRLFGVEAFVQLNLRR